MDEAVAERFTAPGVPEVHALLSPVEVLAGLGGVRGELARGFAFFRFYRLHGV